MQAGLERTFTQLATHCAHEFQHLLRQSLVKIEHCIDQLGDHQIWWRPSESLNSIGNLILHLNGNLRQWTVCGIGNQPDTRQRDTEFEQRQCVPREQLLSLIRNTVDDAIQVIQDLRSTEWLSQTTIQGFQVTHLQAIQHTCTHFVGHTHQIILLARIQLKDDYRFHWSPESSRDVLPL